MPVHACAYAPGAHAHMQAVKRLSSCLSSALESVWSALESVSSALQSAINQPSSWLPRHHQLELTIAPCTELAITPRRALQLKHVADAASSQRAYHHHHHRHHHLPPARSKHPQPVTLDRPELGGLGGFRRSGLTKLGGLGGFHCSGLTKLGGLSSAQCRHDTRRCRPPPQGAARARP